MDRVKTYSWLLTVIMGLAVTTAIKEVASILASPPAEKQLSLWPILIRFGIFLPLSIRWTLGTLWYFDRAYISKNIQSLPAGYLFEFLTAVMNFVIFVGLAVTITSAPSPPSYLSQWLNDIFVGGKEVTTFLWILALLLIYDFIWIVPRLFAWLFLRGTMPRRVHLFWTALNFATFTFCALFFLFYAWQGKDLQDAELPIFIIILFASGIDLWGTVVEDSPLSKYLSP